MINILGVTVLFAVVFTSTQVDYQITVSMRNSYYSGTANTQYVKIKGTQGETEEKECAANFNVYGVDVTCNIQSNVDIGDYRCVLWRTGGNDGWEFTQMKMQIDGKEQLTYKKSPYVAFKDGKTETLCIPVNGGWSGYGDWSDCSKSCGSGTQTRSRTCSKPAPEHGGAECVGDETEEQNCNTDPCPVDYQITVSMRNSYYSGTANTQYVKIKGSQGETEERECTANFNVYGVDVTCNIQSNVDIGDYRCVIWRTGGNDGWEFTQMKMQIDGKEQLTYTKSPYVAFKDGKTETLCIPVDGGWSNYEEWSDCSKSCGSGTQTRSRTCSDPAPEHGGAECVGDKTEEQNCNTDPCPVDYQITVSMRNSYYSGTANTQYVKIKGTLGETEEKECTANFNVYGVDVTCNIQSNVDIGDYRCVLWRTGGNDGWEFTQMKMQIDGKEQLTYTKSPFVAFKDGKTETLCISVDGNWGDWGDWGRCSSPCNDGGSQHRTRLCNNPSKVGAGADCVGYASESQLCNTDVVCPPVWRRVTRGDKIDVYHLETYPLKVKTDSAIKSKEMVQVRFFSEDNKEAGGFRVFFGYPHGNPRYAWLGCSANRDFSGPLPAGDNKVWTFYKAGMTVKLYCNEQEVASAVLDDNVCDSEDYHDNWSKYWNREVTKILFDGVRDTASDAYLASQG